MKSEIFLTQYLLYAWNYCKSVTHPLVSHRCETKADGANITGYTTQHVYRKKKRFKILDRQKYKQQYMFLQNLYNNITTLLEKKFLLNKRNAAHEQPFGMFL